MTLTVFDLAPGDGVQINADPYKGSWATVETVGSDPPEVDVTGAPISKPFEWARVRIDDGVRIYTITYALEDLEKLPPPSKPRYPRPDPPLAHPTFTIGQRVLIRRADGSTLHWDARAIVEEIHSDRTVLVRADGYCHCTENCVFGGWDHSNPDGSAAKVVRTLTLHDIDIVPNPERLPFRRLVLTIDLTDEQLEHFGPEPAHDPAVLIDMIAECHAQIDARWEL